MLSQPPSWAMTCPVAGTEVENFSIHATASARPPKASAGRGVERLEETGWSSRVGNGKAFSGGDRRRRAGRRGARRATRTAGHHLRAGGDAHRARAHPQGAEPHPPHARAFLFLGHRRRTARGAVPAARLRDRRDHRYAISTGRTGTRRPAASWCTTITSRRTTGCRSTRWKRCCAPRWRPCRASKHASAGLRRRWSRSRQRARHRRRRTAGPRCWRPITWSAATADIPWCASRSAFRGAATTSISSWC